MNEADTILDELSAFCLRGAGRVLFEGWDEAILRQWLAWHAGNGTLFVVRSGAGRIVGLGAGRRAMEADLERHWHFDPAGDAFYVEKAVATRPGVLATMAREFQRRFPGWDRLKLFAHRAKGDEPKRRLVRYTAELLPRLQRMEGL